MSYKDNGYFTKDNLDTYLKELGKEFRRLNGTVMPAEVILIGGAAVLANYGFRNMTTDVDAIVHATSAMKDAVNRVGNKFDLPNGWLNSDFMNTDSYSKKLDEISTYYKTFSNVLEVRTVAAEYLIAMKLKSARKYKNDISDIIGILAEHEQSDSPITIEKIDLAVKKLYGGWESIPRDINTFIYGALRTGNFSKLYQSIKEEEASSRDFLIKFEGEHPGIFDESSADEILEELKKRR